MLRERASVTLKFPFTFGQAFGETSDFLSIDYYFFSFRISQKAWSLSVFTWLFVVELAFSRRMFAESKRTTCEALIKKTISAVAVWSQNLSRWARAQRCAKKKQNFPAQGAQRKKKNCHEARSAKKKIIPVTPVNLRSAHKARSMAKLFSMLFLWTLRAGTRREARKFFFSCFPCEP